SAVVLIDGEEVRIDKLGETITLKPGKHGLVVKRGDAVAHTRDFTVVRGENEVLKITLEPLPKLGKPDPIRPVEATGFRPLFNGKDLTGWVSDNTQATEWRVKDGTVSVTGNGAKDSGWLLTERDYTDFVLRFEFRLDKG